MTMAHMTEVDVTEDQPPGTPQPGPADTPVVDQGSNVAPAAPVIGPLTDLGETVGEVRCDDPYVVAESVDVFYGDNHAIQNVTLEISNTTPLPAKIYANEGIAQVLFFEADGECEVSYADKKGKYQRQQSIVLPRL